MHDDRNIAEPGQGGVPGPRRLNLPLYIAVAALAAIIGFVVVDYQLSGLLGGSADSDAIAPGLAGQNGEDEPESQVAKATPHARSSEDTPATAGVIASPGADAASGPAAAALKAAAKGKLGNFLVHATPQTLPDFKIVDAGGVQKTIKDWAGKIVLLNIWATWCGPCREEMPALDRLARQLDGAGFAVVPISIDRGGFAGPKRFFTEHEIKALPLLNDPSGRLNFKLRALGLPTTLLLDRQGREIGRMVGPAEWDSPEAVALIGAALGKQAAQQ